MTDVKRQRLHQVIWAEAFTTGFMPRRLLVLAEDSLLVQVGSVPLKRLPDACESGHPSAGSGSLADWSSLLPSLGILQNCDPLTIIGFSPLFDLLQSSKTAEANIVIIQAAISYAGSLRNAV